MLEIKPDSPLEKAPEDQLEEGRRVRRFFRSLLKWLLVVVVVAGVGAGVYYGWPVLRDRIVEPLDTNTADVGVLQDRLIEQGAELAALTAEVASLAAEIAEVSEAQAGLGDRIGSTESLIAAHTGRLDELDAMQASLGAAAAADLAGVGRQLTMLRSMELLSRARLFLFEANYGLARQDVEAARNLLAAVPSDEADAEVLAETVFRLDRTLANLPGRPVVAANDLDIAWAVLLGEIPPAQATPEEPEETTPTTAP